VVSPLMVMRWVHPPGWQPCGREHGSTEVRSRGIRHGVTEREDALAVLDDEGAETVEQEGRGTIEFVNDRSFAVSVEQEGRGTIEFVNDRSFAVSVEQEGRGTIEFVNDRSFAVSPPVEVDDSPLGQARG